MKNIPQAVKSFRNALLLLITLTFLSACDSDSEISSGAGSAEGDGGATSAQFAGTYRGNMRLNYSGDGIDGNDNFPVTLLIRRNGTVLLTVEGESLDGVIGGNEVSVVLRITHTENGADCEGDAIILATVKGNTVSGPISGEASCKLLVITRDANLSGTINAQKI